MAKVLRSDPYPVQNYFELFDLPVSFDVDPDMLAVRYRTLQQHVHPDKYVTSSAQERRLSIQHAAHINDAFEALKNPLKRAQYLLELKGMLANESGAGLDHGFLMEQMELRETLEAIPEAENPPAALDHFLVEINNYEKEFVETLRGQFAASTEESLKQANVAVKKLQFINKLKEETIELEDQLY